MEKIQYQRVYGNSWNGEWDLEEVGIRSPDEIDNDNVHSLFNVWALGDYGTGAHNEMLTGLERIVFESCWPGSKISRHEINVSDGTTNAFKAEILARRIKCDLGTAQKFVEVFRGLQLRSQDVDKLIADGFEGMSFKNPDDIPKIFVRLVDIDYELPELPGNPTVEYTDEGWLKHKMGYNTRGQLVSLDGEEEWNWPDPAEDDLVNGTPDAFRSIPIGWNNRLIMDSETFEWIYEDPKERDFFSKWFPVQPDNYKKLFSGIGNCILHSDLSAIGKAIHSDPETEKLTRIQQSILWTKYGIQKSKLEKRTQVFADKLVEFVKKYPITQRFKIDGKQRSMGQIIFWYQKGQKVNLSGFQWSQVWKTFKMKTKKKFRPSCSDLNF